MSTQSTLSKLEKEKQKLVQEKCQTLLNDMLRDEDNKYCVDCDAKGPRWASWNLGIYLCIRCAGIHRNLGVHISRVKSVNLDSWTPEQVVTIQQMGNSRARAIYEANMPDTLRRPQTDAALESFIRAKYEHKKYIAKEWVDPGPVKVNWDKEIEDSLRKKKEGKKSGSGDMQLPTPVPKPPNSSPSPLAKTTVKTPVIDARKVAASATKVESATNGHPPPSASDDLFGLMTDTQPAGSSNLFTTSNDTSGISTNPSDDLGSLFSSSDASSTSDLKGKMTKDSILSLYGSVASTANINPFIQTGVTLGNINSQSGIGAPTQAYPQGQMAYAYNPNSNFMGQTQNHSLSQHNTNTFQGLNQLGMQGFGATPLHDMNQVQNQLFGLNLGNNPHQAQVPTMAQNPLGSYGSPLPPQQFSQIQPNLMGPSMNNFMSTTTKIDNLPGLGNSVSQLMQPNLSGSSFWK